MNDFLERMSYIGFMYYEEKEARERKLSKLATDIKNHIDLWDDISLDDYIEILHKNQFTITDLTKADYDFLEREGLKFH